MGAVLLNYRQFRMFWILSHLVVDGSVTDRPADYRMGCHIWNEGTPVEDATAVTQARYILFWRSECHGYRVP